MTRHTIPLQQHLLTRSDLARLEILADQLRHWQATGWLEQIGRLPDSESHGDAVFAVHAPDLRKEFASRLEALGKSAVVMAPQQAKSLLQERCDAETANRSPGAVEQNNAATRGRDSADEPPTAKPVETPWDTDNALATHLLENDLPQVLQEAAAELESEVEGGLATADHEAKGCGNTIDAFDEPFEAEELDVDELHAALANWDPCEQDAAMNELDVPTRPAVATKPPAPKTNPTFARGSARGSDTMVPVMPAATRATDSAASTMSRVETCLGELKSAMAAMTRPEPAAVDLRPIIEAVQTGFEGASRQSAALSSTVHSLTEQLSGASRTVADAMKGSAAARSHAGPPQSVAARDDHLPISLLAMAVLVLCWSLLLWFKTSSPSVAVGTIVGAGAVACCLSAARRARS